MDLAAPARLPLDPRKFRDPAVTARGEPRAVVAPGRLRTLWFNTGTLCNLTCRTCYIESSPHNDRLAWLTAAEVRRYLDEAAALGTEQIGFTGGEPFMNPDLPEMLADVLGRGLDALVLTNAMRPMQRQRARLLALRQPRLTLRVSLDHHTRGLHEAERGRRTWETAIDGLRWLADAGFSVHVAGRRWGAEPEAAARAGYAALFAAIGVAVDAADPVALTLFPELDAAADVAEITTACWGLLHRRPEEMMCASSRMVLRRRDAAAPAVVACTLLPDDPQFELGATLAAALRPVALNHPHCARFCVLGGASCSR